MNMLNRHYLADLIFKKLYDNQEILRETYSKSKNKIGYFFLDDLLPEEITHKIYDSFPKPEDMTQRKSLREFKYIAAQMNNYNPVLEEAIYAFQDRRIVELIGKICEIPVLHPDDNLYAGGISLMGYKNYLNPHLDNSHDKDRNMWRVLNLLYYVTPDWQDENGGHLEIWPDGMSGKQITIHSRFNRLAVMATHNNSWHSVSPVNTKGIRCCVSNYYFSPNPLKNEDSFHITTFRGRPEQKVRDLILQADAFVRSMIRKVFKKGLRENPHVYKKK